MNPSRGCIIMDSCQTPQGDSCQGNPHLEFLKTLNPVVREIRTGAENLCPGLVKTMVPYCSGTIKQLEVEEDKLYLATYTIIFVPVYLDMQHRVWKQDIESMFPDVVHYGDMLTKHYSYYTAFMGFYTPANMKIKNCYGEKCRREIDVLTSGIWCESCHGDFDEEPNVNLRYFMRDGLFFNDFPLRSIVGIRRSIEPVQDISSIQEYIPASANEQTEDIKKKLETWDEETRRMQKQFLKQRRLEKKSLLLLQNVDRHAILSHVEKIRQREKTVTKLGLLLKMLNELETEKQLVQAQIEKEKSLLQHLHE
nr:hypothetical protein Cplu_32 [Cedratvirus plubellavi]